MSLLYCITYAEVNKLDVDLIWLTYWLKALYLRELNKAAAVPGLNRQDVYALEIPLPPLPEQKRIAGILNEQMATVARARAATEAQLKAAKALPAAYLREVFNSPGAQTWPRKRLGDVGHLLPSKSISTDGDVEVCAITTACLSETGFQPSGVKKARMWARDVSECFVSAGEILIARSNTPDLVGRSVMYDGSVKDAVASDLTIRILPNDMMKSAFLAGYLSFLYVNGYWKEKAGGASGSMKKNNEKSSSTRRDSWSLFTGPRADCYSPFGESRGCRLFAKKPSGPTQHHQQTACRTLTLGIQRRIVMFWNCVEATRWVALPGTTPYVASFGTTQRVAPTTGRACGARSGIYGTIS